MLSIPECNKKKTYELRDLYNGFRILYKIIRQLLCIQYNNLKKSELSTNFLTVSDKKVVQSTTNKVNELISSITPSKTLIDYLSSIYTFYLPDIFADTCTL